MSVYYHQPTPSTSTTSSQSHSHRPMRSSKSKFREHLSIQIPPPLDLNLPTIQHEHEYESEKSKFSPESPPPPPFRVLSTLRGSFDKKEKDLEAGPHHLHHNNSITSNSTQAPPRTGRLTRFLFDARTLFGFPPDPDPASLPHAQDLPAWAPLHVSKHPHPAPHDTEKEKKQKKRRRNLLIAILVLLILLLACSISALALALRRSSPASPASSASAPSTAGETAAERDTAACLAQYTLNAPTAPASFPCATCVPLFSPAPAPAPALSAADNATAAALLQFCALADIFAALPASAQANLTHTGGWMATTDFCGWSGVACGAAAAGSVTSLALTTPAVPSVLSESLGHLASLQTLAIAGSGAAPAGPLPDSLAALAGLASVRLQGTGLTLGNNTLQGVEAVVLMQNAAMVLPAGMFAEGAVKSLVINNQPLPPTFLANIAGSAALQASLTLLDLSSTPLNTTLPALGAFAALTELHLDNTGLLALPAAAAAFPPQLAVLTLSGNAALASSGGEGGVCVYAAASSALATCALGGTGLGAPAGGCGVCTF